MQDEPPPNGQPLFGPPPSWGGPPSAGYPGGPPLPPPPPRRSGEVWRGLGLAFLLHLGQIPLGVISSGISLILIGISQLLYLVPAIIIYSKKGRPDLVKGLLIGGGITFLLNAACTGLFFVMLAGADFR
jgi:hypothetical protein